ncbi:DedA family protein [Inquilinus limosus]|uniref:DedA family protein n=1 Tax=Inquilinus limosus TaxID=171674 RepID=UPI000426EECF|nr:DedA family protein [Inquilinus limosus]
MESFVAQVTQFITDNQAWAGPILALLAFGESMAVVGLIVPCTALMLATGALVGGGVLHPAPVILWSIAGAVLGDAVSYWLGQKLGPNARNVWPFSRDRTMIARGRLFFRRWGTASIFLGRFLGPLRAVVPLVAGIMRMRQSRFQIANILSAIVWVPAMLAPGWLVAQGIGELEGIGETEWIVMTGGPLLAGALTLAIFAKLAARRAVPVRARRERPAGNQG